MKKRKHSNVKHKKKTLVKATPQTSIQFPHFSRFITDSRRGLLLVKLWVRKETLKVLIGLASFCIVVLIGIVAVKLYSNIVAKKELEQKRAAIVSEILYWQDVISQYSNYRDAYFKLALLEYQLGNDTGAKEYLAKALILDPNFEEGREFERLLQ